MNPIQLISANGEINRRNLNKEYLIRFWPDNTKRGGRHSRLIGIAKLIEIVGRDQALRMIRKAQESIEEKYTRNLRGRRFDFINR